ncbi:hypothetical protein [Streptomyces sp. CB01881]|nr:hypothetical protein [Streptomyces sp. CB01881]
MLGLLILVILAAVVGAVCQVRTDALNAVDREQGGRHDRPAKVERLGISS